MQDSNHRKTAAYADDLTVAGPIDQIRIWWNTICRLDPKFGCFPEGSKSWIIVRENAKERAQTIFDNTKIKITSTVRDIWELLLVPQISNRKRSISGYQNTSLKQLIHFSSQDSNIIQSISCEQFQTSVKNLNNKKRCKN